MDHPLLTLPPFLTNDVQNHHNLTHHNKLNSLLLVKLKNGITPKDVLHENLY